MSIPVDIDRLAAVVADYSAAYLLTTRADGRVKAVWAEPAVTDGVLILQPSKGSAANLAGNPRATLLFPPPAPKGYTLLVDGVATADAPEAEIRFTPHTAVLHRPARHADGPPAPDTVTGCANDCTPL